MDTKSAYILGSKEYKPNTLYIDAKRIILKDKELGIEIDISEKLKEIEKICISGVYYIKDK